MRRPLTNRENPSSAFSIHYEHFIKMTEISNLFGKISVTLQFCPLGLTCITFVILNRIMMFNVVLIRRDTSNHL